MGNRTLEQLKKSILDRDLSDEEFDETGRQDANYFITLCGKNAKILDFGCGIGRILKYLPPSSEGYDVDPEMREWAQKWCGRIILDNLHDKAETYDCVIACLVIQHVPFAELPHVEEKLCNVLKLGGKLIVLDTDPKISQLEFRCLSEHFQIVDWQKRGNEIVRIYEKVSLNESKHEPV